MKTLANPNDKNEILRRLQSIQPTTQRRWGKMSAHQMICHLSDGYRMYMNEKIVAPEPQRIPPAVFEADMRELQKLVERFTQHPRDFRWQPHPHFGPLSEKEWMRLGYLHPDHHLRQFGA